MEELKKKPALSSSARGPARLAVLVGAFVLGSLVATTAEAEDCVPACRDGYLCHQGQCIEACNPPCGEGEQCVSGGECVAKAPAAPTYTAVNTSGGSAAADTGGKPSVALPATFVGLGGFFLIAGGVTFGTSEWDGYYGEYWGTGQWVGVGLMTIGAIMLVTATPFLAIRAKEKRDWERQHAGVWGHKLSVAPVVTPVSHNRAYGVTLRGRF
jgi:hypothetical protein